MKFHRKSGQALIEYLILFSVMAMIGMALVNSLTGMMASSFGTLGYKLSVELTSGVCESDCFFSGYKNWK